MRRWLLGSVTILVAVIMLFTRIDADELVKVGPGLFTEGIEATYHIPPNTPTIFDDNLTFNMLLKTGPYRVTLKPEVEEFKFQAPVSISNNDCPIMYEDNFDNREGVDIIASTFNNVIRFMRRVPAENGYKIVGYANFRSYKDPGGSGHMVIADFNNDGLKDLLVFRNNERYGSRRHAVLYYERTGEASFNVKVLKSRYDTRNCWSVLSNWWTATFMATGDHNGDGYEDVYIISGDGRIYVALNNKGKGFSCPQFLLNTGMRRHGRGSHVIAVGDMNGDSALDIVVASTENADVRIYYREGESYRREDLYRTRWRFVRPTSKVSRDSDPFTGAVTAIKLADVNNDGRLDIVLATDNWQFRPVGVNYRKLRPARYPSRVGGRAYVIYQNEDGTFSTRYIGQEGYDADGLWVGDIDGNGTVDVIVPDGNDTRSFGVFVNEASTVYVANGRLVTLPLINPAPGSGSADWNRFDTALYRISSVRLRADYEAASYDVRFYIATSQSGGAWNWVDVTDAVNSESWIPVDTTQLLWKVEFNSTQDAPTTAPTIYKVDLEYKVLSNELKVKSWQELR